MMLIGIGLWLSLLLFAEKPNKEEHMRLLTEKQTERNNLVQEQVELKKRLSVENQKE